MRNQSNNWRWSLMFAFAMVGIAATTSLAQEESSGDQASAGSVPIEQSIQSDDAAGGGRLTQDAAELFPQLATPDFGDQLSAGPDGFSDWQLTGASDDAAEADHGDAGSPAPKEAEPFRDGDYVVQWQAWIDAEPESDQAIAELVFRAVPDKGFHVYASSVTGEESSTAFALTDKSDMAVGAPNTKNEVVSKVLFEGLPPIRFHEGTVTWRLPVRISANSQTGTAELKGLITYQACTDTSCRQPVALEFVAPMKIDVAAKSAAAAGPIRLTSTAFGPAADQAASLNWVDKAIESEPVDAAAPVPSIDQPEDEYSFATMLFFAFIGGIILNVMPCVLPVVGLKVMSFVEQAGEDRKRVFMLNMVYALGILSVFALLAVLAVVAGLSWGEQFTFFPLKLGLTLVLFALALSYLGVWEIPVPGMASGKVSQDLQQREGYAGAFSKGIFATILATPCSGPLLGTIFGLSIFLSGPEKFLVMMTVGLGMAVPYLLIGLNPKLVAWLPKPGGWMETFKEFLAFLLLGTVAFFFAGFADDLKLPVFVSLIGVWFGCWIIGRVPNWETVQKRLFAWAGGLAAAAVIGIGSFVALAPVDDEMGWVPYSEARLQALHDEGRTVMLDFTASWCVNCKINSKFAIDTEKTRELVDELDAVPMLADWSDRNDQIKSKLAELRSNSIPLLVIFPGSDPAEPIILRDLVSQTSVLDALRKAGPSVDSQIAKGSGDTSRQLVTTR
ncbi:protein-disulfide reductase DsbD family protein [Crateriforma conspicua]|nr:thioredoxin family protein [Crateriforma conspicua]